MVLALVVTVLTSVVAATCTRTACTSSTNSSVAYSTRYLSISSPPSNAGAEKLARSDVPSSTASETLSGAPGSRGIGTTYGGEPIAAGPWPSLLTANTRK